MSEDPALTEPREAGKPLAEPGLAAVAGGGSGRRRVPTFIWCLAVLAVVGAWFLVRIRQTAPRRAAVAAIEELSGTVWYEEQLTYGVWNQAPQPSVWRQWLSDPQVVRVFLKKHTGDAELEELKPHLQNLPELRDLVLMGSPVSDEGLLHLHDVVQVKRVVLIKTQATRQGVSELRIALPRCTVRRADSVTPFIGSPPAPAAGE